MKQLQEKEQQRTQVMLKSAPGQVSIIADVSLRQRTSTANSNLQSFWKVSGHWQSKWYKTLELMW